MNFDIEIYKGDDNVYIASARELDIYSSGETEGEAVRKLKEKIRDLAIKLNSFSEAQKDINYSLRYYSARLPQTH